jgi:hypothetical protein
MLFTLILIFHLGSGTATVAIPHYSGIEECEKAATEVKQNDKEYDIGGSLCVREPR